MGKSCYRIPSNFPAATMKINVHVLLSQYSKTHIRRSYTSKLTCPPDYWELVFNKWTAESEACRQPLMVHLPSAGVLWYRQQSWACKNLDAVKIRMWLCERSSMWFNQWELWFPQCMIAFKTNHLSVYHVAFVSWGISFCSSPEATLLISLLAWRQHQPVAASGKDRSCFARHYSQNLMKRSL